MMKLSALIKKRISTSSKMHVFSLEEKQPKLSTQNQQGKRSKNLTSKNIIRKFRCQTQTHHHGRTAVGPRNAFVAAYHFRHVNVKLKEIMSEWKEDQICISEILKWWNQKSSQISHLVSLGGCCSKQSVWPRASI